MDTLARLLAIYGAWWRIYKPYVDDAKVVWKTFSKLASWSNPLQIKFLKYFRFCEHTIQTNVMTRSNIQKK